MKKILALLLAVVMVLGMVACASKTETPAETTTTEPAATETTEETKTEEPAAEETTEEPAEETGAVIQKVALVTDVGTIDDESFNQATWQGVKAYCEANGIEYTYYQPTEDSTEARCISIDQAIKEGANVVVMPGYLFGASIVREQEKYPEVYFIAVDVGAGDLTEDYATYYDPAANVVCATFAEEQAGYLAGYAVVMDGYTKLGFSGGGGGENPACCRFGYGFVQGANDAAKAGGKTVEMNYSWLYGNSFSASSELQTMLNGWYTNGTEVVFACGGSMCQSAFAAAAANDGVVIGVDVDQSSQSDTVVTSAMKGLTESVIYALGKFYAGEFDALGDISTVLGAANDAVGLPTATWSFKKFSVKDYDALLKSMKDGKVTVDNDYTKLAADLFANVKLNIVE